MKDLCLIQGSDEWKEARKNKYTASLAPGIMGCGYVSRDVLIRDVLGLKVEKPNSYLQKMFNAGHKVEAETRPVIEAETDEILSPLSGTRTVDDMKLFASFDGINIDQSFIWECKHSGKVIFDTIPPLYYWQLEHQLLVAEAKKARLTMVDKLNNNKLYQYDYTSKPERVVALLSGWKKWGTDLANYVRSSPEWIRVTKAYKKIKIMQSRVLSSEQQLKEDLIKLTGESSAQGNGVRVSVSEYHTKTETASAYVKRNKVELLKKRFG